MAFGNNGVFSRLYNWVNDRGSGETIQAGRMDAEFDGIADALTDLKSSSSVPERGTAAIPAYPFTDDLDTGVYSPAADKIALAAGGEVVLEIDPTLAGAARLKLFGKSIAVFLGLGTFESALGSLNALQLQKLKHDVGTVAWFASPNSLPVGWYECTGQSLNRADHSALFAKIGVIHGGYDAYTFKVPDLRRKTVIGAGGASAPNSNGPEIYVGNVGGDEAITGVPSHFHGDGTLTADDTDHAHGDGTLVAVNGGLHAHGSGTYAVSEAGDHLHTYKLRVGDGGTGDAAGSEGRLEDHHPSGDTSTAGAHTHDISGLSGYKGSHGHAVSGRTSGDSHGHAVSGDTGTTGSPKVGIMQPSMVLHAAIFSGV